MSNYIETINKKYQRPIGIDATTKITVFDTLEQQIKMWANCNGYSLTDIKLSGSRAKGTAISLASDMDMFISLSSANTASLGTIFNSLFTYFNTSYLCRKQNVSVRVTYNGLNVDLVPGKRQSQYGCDHSLYKSKQDTWMKTNVDEHINIVKNSPRAPEIVAVKIWRQRHNLPFPSIFLELVIIEALKNKGTSDHDTNFLSLLDYLHGNIQTVRIIDPANTNNILSNDICASEKKAIADKARESRSKKSWNEILW